MTQNYSQIFLTLKTVVELFAIGFASVYFIYRFISGIDNATLELEVKINRQSFSDNTDILVVGLNLKNGTISSLFLRGIYFRLINSLGEVFQQMKMTGTGKIRITEDNELEDWLSDNKNLYSLSTSEKVSFSDYIMVPKNEVIKIEFLVVGQRRKILPAPAQYRSSAVSLPLTSFNKNGA